MTREIIVFFILLITMLSNRCLGQWNLIHQDTNYVHMEMHFLNTDTGFVVGVDWTSGTGGSIFKTVDGGNSWSILNTTFGNFSVNFPSESVGYTGGHDGSVLKTVDMGTTWNDMPSWCCNDYSNSHFFNIDTGFVVWWGGEIVKTINGSNSWSYDTSIGGYSPFPGLGSIQFINDSIGIIAAGQYGTYAKTIDGAMSWNISSIDSNMWVNSIYMKNTNVGYAIGYSGKYSKTFDGGNTWTTPVGISQYTLHNIAFFTDSIGYIVGGNSSFGGNPNLPYKGLILKTENGGNSWFVEDSSFNDILISIYSVDSNIGYIAGGMGRILKITNASATSLDDNPNKPVFTIYPNPAKSEIKLNLLKYGIGTFYLYNTFGSLILTSKITGQQNLDIQKITSGLYSYKWIGKDGTIVAGKLVIQQ